MKLKQVRKKTQLYNIINIQEVEIQHMVFQMKMNYKIIFMIFKTHHQINYHTIIIIMIIILHIIHMEIIVQHMLIIIIIQEIIEELQIIIFLHQIKLLKIQLLHLILIQVMKII